MLRELAWMSLENTMQEELLKLENEFARAVANNDAHALDGFLADD